MFYSNVRLFIYFFFNVGSFWVGSQGAGWLGSGLPGSQQ